MSEQSGQPVDFFTRGIIYFRVSLTDQCNHSCLCCTPRPLGEKLPFRELLSYEERLAVLRVAVVMGVRKGAAGRWRASAPARRGKDCRRTAQDPRTGGCAAAAGIRERLAQLGGLVPVLRVADGIPAPS